jgi:hypothetical protein
VSSHTGNITQEVKSRRLRGAVLAVHKMEKCALHSFGKHEKRPARSLVVDGALKETGYNDVTLLSCLMANFYGSGDETWIP